MTGKQRRARQASHKEAYNLGYHVGRREGNAGVSSKGGGEPCPFAQGSDEQAAWLSGFQAGARKAEAPPSAVVTVTRPDVVWGPAPVSLHVGDGEDGRSLSADVECRVIVGPSGKFVAQRADHDQWARLYDEDAIAVLGEALSHARGMKKAS